MNGNHQCSTQIAVPYPQAILVKPRIAHEGMKKREMLWTQNSVVLEK